MLLYICVIAHQTIQVQLCHVSLQKYHPFTKILTFNLIVMVASIVYREIYPSSSIDTRLLGAILLIVTVTFQWIYILRAVYEMTICLNISVFSIKPQTEQGV